MWSFIIKSYLKNEENKTKEFFNCFICELNIQKTPSNEILIGNINKIFYICSNKCHKKFLDKKIITKLIAFEKLSELEKNKLISKYEGDINLKNNNYIEDNK